MAGENEDLYRSESKGHSLSWGNRKDWRLGTWRVRSDPEFELDVGSRIACSDCWLFVSS